MNTDLQGDEIFTSGTEMEIIDRDPERLIALVETYAQDREGLRRLALRGRNALLREYSYARQLGPRIALLRAALEG